MMKMVVQKLLHTLTISLNNADDIIAHNFWGEKFQIYGEAKSSNDFYNNDPDSVMT